MNICILLISVRILDPLLHSILSKKILRVAETVEVNERKIKIYHYKSFGNAHYIRFSLRALSDCICKYGDTFLYAHFKSEYEMLSAFDDDPCGNHGGSFYWFH